MFRVTVFLSFLALCCSHAVLPHLPLVVPAAHSVHVPLVSSYHGYGHGPWGHGFLGKPLGHHVFKRSPHLVAPLAHGHVGHLEHVAPISHVAHVAPIAVSHQSRVDVRTSPAIAPVAVVKPVIAPVVAAPLALGSYGLGHYAASHGHYGAGLGYLGAGYGHLGAGHGYLEAGHGHLGAGHGHLGAGHGHFGVSHLGHY